MEKWVKVLISIIITILFTGLLIFSIVYAVRHNKKEKDKENEEKNNSIIKTYIITEKESQKGIIIGKNARTLKAVGTAARKELEEILEKKVFLKTIVSVKNNWQDNDSILKSMNLGNEL